MLSINATRQVAQLLNWDEVTPYGYHRVFSFKSHDDRIDVYTATGTIVAFLKHPEEGRVQLAFPRSSLGKLSEMFENPRLLLSPAYPDSQDKPRPVQVRIRDDEVPKIEHIEHTMMSSYLKALDREQARIQHHRSNLTAHIHQLNVNLEFELQEDEEWAAELAQENKQGHNKENKDGELHKIHSKTNQAMGGNGEFQNKEDTIQAQNQVKGEDEIEVQGQGKEEDRIEVQEQAYAAESKWTGAGGSSAGKANSKAGMKRERQLDGSAPEDGPKRKKARNPNKSILEVHGTELTHNLKIPEDPFKISDALDKLLEPELAETKFLSTQVSEEFPIVRCITHDGKVHCIGRTFKFPALVEEKLEVTKSPLQAFAFESRKRYLIQWEDGTRIQKGYGMDAVIGDSNVELVALGPDNSFFIKFDDGEMESGNLPMTLKGQLDNVRKGHRPPVKYLSLGPKKKYFICFEDGEFSFDDLDSDEITFLKQLRCPIHEVAFTKFGMIVRYTPLAVPNTAEQNVKIDAKNFGYAEYRWY